ncbi:uncharacterized protein K452DRAFT_269027 [Aplosporella prunicola CBS 121167]|uniref:SAM-dependent MTase RsmB/NOP-type domain-containing protein n=1 Tax=Aplosporella prunicola CBS 121167 TaxID=1176127 RepID=A0A6A6BJH1_9PEZI|nr:uncharacterized protein K452DRAFT_269027 [Aplosporella prunicola CBS 121167]KAF2143475.1 hypothetical protein K452DRAFT_269027 [Aplosporella prunicola CBS 121167]
MSLYYEAAAFLENADNVGGSLTSRIYGKKGLKSRPAAIYALITEATKWSAALKDVVERSDVLKLERKLTPLLATLLTHDLLLSKGGVAAPANHPLRLAITRHKARLGAELTKLRVKRGFSSIDAFRQYVNAHSGSAEDAPGTAKEPEHPRWVRVNAVRTTLAKQLHGTFAEWKQDASLADVMAAKAGARVLHLDAHIPDLLALPPRTDLSKSPAYRAGELIIQDKASCFPAYLLNVQPGDGDVIDGCAAPGNKTTHLAAIVSKFGKKQQKQQQQQQRIWACERDKRRSGILEKMVQLAGADKLIAIKASQDFMDLNPKDEAVSAVGAILLDPSCSGSGIVGRDDDVKLVLPSASTNNSSNGHANARGKKRKRNQSQTQAQVQDQPTTTITADEPALPLEEEETPDDAAGSSSDAQHHARLISLASFQLKILLHAMRFPAARKLTYSTCSIHGIENEGVVLSALRSGVALKRGWRLLRREEQVEGMRAWGVRGERGACEEWVEREGEGVALGEVEGRDVADACLRCRKGTEEGTMGFFVAAFVREGEDGDAEGEGEREGGEDEGDEDEDEWSGFSDGD